MPPAKNYFGSAVALCADGHVAMIGGSGDNGSKGAAWVFEPKLVAGAEASGLSLFGHSVALSSDGNTALVGAPYDGSGGAAWVFTRSGSNWSQQGPKLTVKGAEGLGWSVALSADGTRRSSARPSRAPEKARRSCLHDRAGHGRSRAERSPAAKRPAPPNWGRIVALSSDGNTALAGGPNDNSEKGAAWVFTRSGSTWSQQGGKIMGAGETGAGAFGYGVALSSDGNTALVGGPYNGAAWVFTRSGGKWTQQHELTGAGGDAVALSADGNTAVTVGEGEGVTTFVRTGETWAQQGEPLTISSGGRFDKSISLSSSGDILAVGGDDDGAGAAWTFTRTGSTWTEQGGALQGAGEVGEAEESGSVALSSNGGTALLGYGEEGFNFPGAAWVFVNPPAVTTGAASEPTESSATVEATVNPNGVPVSECKFEYGPTPSYGSSVPCSASAGSGLTPVTVSAPLNGLSPNTRYDFRIAARNESGVSFGEDETFTTPETSKFKSAGSPSEPATATDGQLTATASGGIGTVTVGHYAGNPVTATPFTSTGDFTDVSLSAGNSFTKLEFKDCELKGGTTLWWYSPVLHWEPLSDPPAEHSEAPACFTVKITEATTPSLAQMSGTEIAAATPAPRHVGHHEAVEYGRCVPEKKGYFSDERCLVGDESSKGKGKGTFEWYAPGEAEYLCFAKKHGFYTEGTCATKKEKKGQPVEKGKDEAATSKFSSTGTPNVKIESALGPVECSGGGMEGQVRLVKAATLTFKYTGCDWGGYKCKSTEPAEPEGTIKTPELLSVLIEEDKHVLVEVKGNPRIPGEPLMEFKCGEHEFKLSGTVTGEASGGEIDTMSEAMELKFAPTIGSQTALVLADPLGTVSPGSTNLGGVPVESTLTTSIATMAEQRPWADSMQEIYAEGLAP